MPTSPPTKTTTTTPPASPKGTPPPAVTTPPDGTPSTAPPRPSSVGRPSVARASMAAGGAPPTDPLRASVAHPTSPIPGDPAAGVDGVPPTSPAHPLNPLNPMNPMESAGGAGDLPADATAHPPGTEPPSSTPGQGQHETAIVPGSSERKSLKDAGGVAPGGEVPPGGEGGGEKRKSIPPILTEPKEGGGPIATADKGAVELAGKVKKFFNEAEGARLREEAMKPLKRPKKMYHNSFRLDSNIRYSRDRAQKILESTLEEMIDGYCYTSETAGDLAIKTAEKVRSRVLAMKFDRYKVIVMTNVGPLNRQGIHIGFRCLVDQERDTYNIATAKSTHAFLTAVIYAIYLE